jgi:hypothetical protein
MKTKKRQNPVESILKEQARTEAKFFRSFLPTWNREVGRAVSIGRQERWR